MKTNKARVIIRVWGGIGNQLFQYYFGLNLKKYHNIDLIFDTYSFNPSFFIKNRHLVKRNLFVTKLEPKNYTLFNKSFLIHNVFQNIYIRKILKILSINKISIGNFNYIIEKCSYDKLNFHSKKSYYFDGYWQDIYGFYSNNVHLKLDNFASEKAKSFIDVNKGLLPVVAVHVRQPDHKGKKFYKLPKINYYYSAIKYFDNLYNGKFLLWFFSNDSTYIEENFRLLYPNLINCSLILKLNEDEELFLMSNANHIIVSNSSFSWWAANLIKDPKFVIAPNFWQDKSDYNKIYPKDWIIMEDHS